MSDIRKMFPHYHEKFGFRQPPKLTIVKLYEEREEK